MGFIVYWVPDDADPAEQNSGGITGPRQVVADIKARKTVGDVMPDPPWWIKTVGPRTMLTSVRSSNGAPVIVDDHLAKLKLSALPSLSYLHDPSGKQVHSILFAVEKGGKLADDIRYSLYRRLPQGASGEQSPQRPIEGLQVDIGQGGAGVTVGPDGASMNAGGATLDFNGRR